MIVVFPPSISHIDYNAFVECIGIIQEKKCIRQIFNFLFCFAIRDSESEPAWQVHKKIASHPEDIR